MTATISDRSSPQQPEPPARITAECVGPLATVPSSAWDSLIQRGSAPLRHGYLTAWEHAELAGLESRPIIAHTGDRNRPVAACPGYFYDLDVPTVRTPQIAGAAAAVRRLWPHFLLVRTYELGSPTPLANPFLVADQLPRQRAVPSLIEAAVDEGARGRAGFILVQNFTSRSTPGGEELARRGFAGVPIPPTAVVDLPYESFEDYLAAMRAQYRRRAQQTLKRSRELTVEHVAEFGHLADELARLWKSIYVRASEVKREVLTPAFFRAVSDVQDASVLVTRRPDGSIASFALLLADDPWLSFLQCGFEAEAGRREGAYFRLLYEIVRFAIDAGYEQVDLGITTLNPKLDVGAVPVPLFAWLRHRSPPLQRAIRAVAERVMRPPQIAPRKVFKEAPPAAAELVRRRGLPA